MDVFLHNGEIKPRDQAVASLYSVEFSYGFGVYENIRVKKGMALYSDEHVTRLLASAEAIQLEHTLTEQIIEGYVEHLVGQINQAAYNLKLLLIGARRAEDAQFYCLPLKPKFPDRKLYRTGARAITMHYERYLPNAKTLNMLPSYLAHRRAQEQNAYDTIFVNRRGEMVEGSRTNLFALRGQTLYTPPADEVLIGVTRTHVIATAEATGLTVIEQALPLSDIDSYDSFFLTSTSSKIMPLRSIDDEQLTISDALHELMRQFAFKSD